MPRKARIISHCIYISRLDITPYGVLLYNTFWCYIYNYETPCTNGIGCITRRS